MENIKRLKALLTLLIILMIALVTVLFYQRRLKADPLTFSFSSLMPSEQKAQPETAQRVEETEPITEPAETVPVETLPTEISRYVVDKHTVVWGECFSLITGEYWDDMFLWPDLYLLNDMKSGDPDLIYPDEVIEIFNRLGEGDNYTNRETEKILDAYIEVYKIYKGLGEKKNNSAWSLLWCAAKYDEDFLETYSDKIDPADKAIAQKYINEKGIID